MDSKKACSTYRIRLEKLKQKTTQDRVSCVFSDLPKKEDGREMHAKRAFRDRAAVYS